MCGYGSVECGPSSLTLALKRSIMIAGWIKNKKDWNYILLDTIYNRGINPMYRVKNLKDAFSKMEL